MKMFNSCTQAGKTPKQQTGQELKWYILNEKNNRQDSGLKSKMRNPTFFFTNASFINSIYAI